MRLRRFERAGASFSEDFKNGIEDLTNRGFTTAGVGSGESEPGPNGLPAVNLNNLSLTLSSGKARVLTHIDGSSLADAAFSIFFWFKTNDGASAEIVSKKTVSTNNHYTIEFNGTNIVASVSTGGTNNSVTSSVAIETGKWHFICFSYGTEDGFILNVDDIESTNSTNGKADRQESDFVINPGQADISMSQLVFWHKHMIFAPETLLIRNGRIFDYDINELYRYDFSTVNPQDVSNRGFRNHMVSTNVTSEDIVDSRKNGVKAMRFRKSKASYCSLSNTSKFITLSTGGISFWVKLNHFLPSGLTAFYSHNDDSFKGSIVTGYIGYSTSTNELIFEVGASPSVGRVINDYLNWMFVSMAWDGTFHYNLVNGLHTLERTTSQVIKISGQPLSSVGEGFRLGQHLSGSFNSVDCDIYDLRIYDKCLFPIQQRDLYARTR